jgi:pre-rRNA-processing protein TSR1
MQQSTRSKRPQKVHLIVSRSDLFQSAIYAGRTQKQSPKSTASPVAAAQARLNRKNNAKQNQTKKRQALVSATRLFSGTDGAPRIVAVIPLTPDVSARDTVCSLAEALDSPAEDCPESGLWKLKFVS